MKKFHALSVAIAIFAALFLASTAVAQEVAVAAADGTQEVPAISTSGGAIFIGSISDDLSQIIYQVQYQRTRGTVLQSHIHIGQPGVNGGIMLFVCTNLGNGPADTPPCPTPGGTVNGVWTAGDIVAVPNQGIGGGPASLRRAINAMRAGVAYLNIHTDMHPAGEIRGGVSVLSGKSELSAVLGDIDGLELP